MVKFSFKHDLNSLSENEIEEYLRGISEYFKVDPDLNLFDTIWMNSEDGIGRKRVVYARRGTCEILRDIHGIAIGASTKEDGPGYVSFQTVAVKMSTGRQEIGVGAHSTAGLTGQKLADAVMTSHTRSTRRATLQVIGGGILDVSEVTPQAVENVAHTSSLAQLAGSPTVLPPPQIQPFTVLTNESSRSSQNETLPTSVPTQVNLDVPVQVDPVSQPRKPRRKRNTVDISSPGQEPVQTEIPAGHIDKDDQITPLTAVSTPFVPKPIVFNEQECVIEPHELAVPPATANEPEKGAIGNDASAAPSHAVIEKANENEVEKVSYRERSAKYSQDILPKAGMLPSAGIGGITMKMRKFATTFAGLPDGTSLTPAQSEDLFEFMDGFVAKNGAVALVAHINESIGAI